MVSTKTLLREETLGEEPVQIRKLKPERGSDKEACAPKQTRGLLAE